MIPFEDAEVDREVTKTCSRLIGLADQFWTGFREGRNEDGRESRYPIVPGTFARRGTDGETASHAARRCLHRG